MAITKGRFPAPEDNDADDVVLALETANALWRRGDSREAIRWLRRAAEAAEETGNDMRALSLARTAAELTGDLENSASAPASGFPPASAPRASKPPAQPASVKPAPTAKAVPKAQSVPPAAAEPPRPARSSTPPPSGPSSPASSPLPPSAAMEMLSRRAAAQPSSPGRSSGGERAKDAMAHLAALASLDASTGATPRTRRNLGPYQTLRVSVEPSKDDRKSLYVRVLNQSEEAPPTAHEAMLVSMRPNIDMRSRKRS
jgi:hypothetical protein